MFKTNIPVKTPKPDMNPMVDMAFLLVSFFMLTTTFKAAEPILIEKPQSQSEIKMPETSVATITVGEEGRIFFTVDGKYTRKKLLKMIGDRHQIDFSGREQDEFALLPSVGLSVEQLPDFLALNPQERKNIDQPGIPCDTARNELSDWVVLARVANPGVRMAVNADKDTPYAYIDRIIRTLQHNKIYRFNLITELESTE